MIDKNSLLEIFIRHDREGARSAAEASDGGAGVGTPALYQILKFKK